MILDPPDDRRTAMHRPARNAAPPNARVCLLAFASAVGLAVSPIAAHAQAGKHGAYVGTAKISYKEGEPPNPLEIRSEVKITIPLTSVGARSAMADLDASGAPATMKVTHFETSQRFPPDASGKIHSISCKLAAPAEIPVMAQGTMDLDYRKKTYSMFIALLGMKDVTLDCVHSGAGPSKRQQGVAVSLGTHEAGQAFGGLPYTDPARLVAKHTMVPGPQMKDKRVRVDQEWELQLKR
jgi:hypothetical protein